MISHPSPAGDKEADEEDSEDDAGGDPRDDHDNGSGRSAQVEARLAARHGFRVRHTWKDVVKLLKRLSFTQKMLSGPEASFLNVVSAYGKSSRLQENFA
jgi:hypothetical protein